jgi:hypothetical protein
VYITAGPGMEAAIAPRIKVRPSGAEPELDSRPMTSDDLDHYRRRVFAYAATRGQMGFDQQKLHDMVSGCAHRQELLRTDLKAGEMLILRGIMGRERLDLWS